MYNLFVSRCSDCEYAPISYKKKQDERSNAKTKRGKVIKPRLIHKFGVSVYVRGGKQQLTDKLTTTIYEVAGECGDFVT